MAIARKPKATPKEQPARGVDIDALIHKGGSVASAHVKDGEPVPLLLRVPADLSSRITLSIKARPLKISRHQWILEAIVEKLEREVSV